MTCNLDPIDSFLAVTDYSATSPRTMTNSAGNVGFAPHNLILASEDFSDSNWTKTNTTVTSNAAAAPDGTITADKISHTSTSGSQIVQGVTVVSSGDYVSGLFMKYIDHQWVRVWLDTGDDVWIDLSGEVLGTDNTGGASLIVLADNWLYLSVATTAPDTFRSMTVSLVDGDTSTTRVSGTSAYIWGAHLYENGLAGMFDVPEDQRALASLTKYLPNKAVVTGPNLVSNGTFDSSTAGWTAVDGTIAVSGGALLVSNDGTGSNIGYAYQAITTEVGKSYRVGFENVDTDLPAIRVGTSVYGTDLLVYNNVPQGVHTGHFTATSTTTYVTLSNNAFAGAANRKWDNITVTKVDRDPTAARFLPRRNNHEYIDGAWVKGLKVESEARTNLVTESNLGNFIGANGTIALNAAVGLDGKSTAATFVENTATGLHQTQDLTITGDESETYTASIVIKPLAGSADRDLVLMVFENTAVTDYFSVEVDTSTWTITGTNASAGAQVDTATLVPEGDGKYRVSVTGIPKVGGGNSALRMTTRLKETGNVNYTGDGVSGFSLEAVQLEAGSTPSSLIPTYGATRTRTAETFTQKEDKIIWPNTTYVDGTELVTNGTFATNDLTGWTDNSVGAGTVVASTGAAVHTGASGSDSARLYQDLTLVSGSVYELTFTISDLTTPSGLVRCGASTTGSEEFSFDVDANGEGTHTVVFVSGGVTRKLNTYSVNGAFTIDNISVKEINPRALAVVMHGYMTYADENVSNEAIFWRQYADADNQIRVRLETNSGSGGFGLEQEVNGTSDYCTGDADLYSPGINAPFKIASRHLDNAVQGAADGTATTENTTPPGLPDLSATQTEWFYDFMGHITFVGKGQEASADRLDSTNGPTTLTTATSGGFLS